MKMPEHIVVARLKIYGCKNSREAAEEIKEQIENGLRVQGISGTQILEVKPE